MAKAQIQIVVFVGTDEGRVQQEALAAVRRLTPPDAGEFGVETINGTAENSDDARRICRETVQALQTLPFFGGGKVVWLKNAGFLTDSVTGRANATQEGIEALQRTLEQGLGEGVFLVLNATGIDKRRAFYKTLKKLGEVKEFDLPDMSRSGWEEAALANALEMASTRSLQFDQPALQRLVMLAGADSRQLKAEMEKIDLFLGPSPDSAPRRVAEDVVATLVAHTRSAVVFAVGDAVGRRDLKSALEQVELLMGQGESPLAILLAAIVPKIRNLLVAKSLQQESGIGARSYKELQSGLDRLPEDRTRHIARTKTGGFNAYPVWLSMQESRRFELAELRSALGHSLAANKALVTSQLDGRVVLAKLLAQVLGGGGKAGRRRAS